jgi:hypothetical protein
VLAVGNALGDRHCLRLPVTRPAMKSPGHVHTPDEVRLGRNDKGERLAAAVSVQKPD